jgi:flagellar motor switch protein FliN
MDDAPTESPTSTDVPNAFTAAGAGAFGQVPIEITISVGKARPMISELLALSKDSILQLDRRLDDPVELYIGDKMIARGTLAEIEGDDTGRLAVRLTEVADLTSGF